MAVNPVKETTLEVIKNARDVYIDRNAVLDLASKWNKSGLPIAAWDKKMHLQTDNAERMLTYLILLDGLNFCFWNPYVNRWEISYGAKTYSGYFGLSLCLKKFFEQHPKRATLSYFSNISFSEFLKILQGGKGLLFLEERWQIIRQVCRYISINYGSAKNFVSSGKNQLSILIPKISLELSSFQDHIWIGNHQRIYFWKRAQILAMDIYGAFNGKGPGYFEDLGYPTCFPDYKLPQILEHWGIIKYSPALKTMVKNQCLIPAGSREEIEIRSATVWAVELLKEELKACGGSYRSFELDWLLWEKSQQEKMALPHHRTQTIFY